MSGSKSSQTSAQTDNKLGASDIDGGLTQLGTNSTLSIISNDQFSDNVAEAFVASLDNTKAAIAAGAQNTKAALTNLAQTQQLSTTGTTALTPTNMLLAIGGLGVMMLLTRK